MPSPARFRLITGLSLLCVTPWLTAAFFQPAPAPAPTTPPAPTAPPTPTAPSPATPATASTPLGLAPSALPGRYPKGTVGAPLQVVVFADFQCSECRRVDGLLEELLTKRTDVQLTMRHFPLSTDCNRAATANTHPNSCKASIAAEAVGMLAGPVAFWRMHDWLIAMGGNFQDAELGAQLTTLGIDANAFGTALRDGSALALVHSDIDTAITAGLHSTPMVLINGEEVTNYATLADLDEACTKALENAKKGIGPTPLTPARAWLKRWQEEKPHPEVAQDAHRWIGAAAAQATIEVVLFGDLQERATAKADRWIRQILKERTDTRYTFRHYPVDRSCNSGITRSLHPLACRFAQTEEAMGAAAGDEAYWKTHDRILIGLQNGKGQDFTDANLRDLAAEFKLDPEQILKDRDAQETKDLLQKDIAAGTRIRISELPTIFVNGKRVARFQGPGVTDDAVLRLIIESAAAGH